MLHSHAPLCQLSGAARPHQGGRLPLIGAAGSGTGDWGIQPALEAKGGIQPALQAKEGIQPALAPAPVPGDTACTSAWDSLGIQPALESKEGIQPALQAKAEQLRWAGRGGSREGPFELYISFVMDEDKSLSSAAGSLPGQPLPGT